MGTVPSKRMRAIMREGAGRRVDAYIVTWRRQLGASKRGNSPEA